MTQKKPVAKLIVGADQDKPFLFEHEGKAYKLPPAAEALKSVDGGAYMDAVLEGDQGMVRLALLTLKSGAVAVDAYAALRAKPLTEFMEIVGKWVATAGDASGE